MVYSLGWLWVVVVSRSVEREGGRGKYIMWTVNVALHARKRERDDRTA